MMYWDTMSETTQPDARRPSLALSLLVAMFTGALAATQSRINGELAARLDDGYVAALISFGSGLLILVVVVAVWTPGRRGVAAVRMAVHRGTMPWWYLIGGVAGAFFVLAQSITTAVLGVALFTIAAVSGQTVAGLVVDKVGLGSMAPSPVTITRAAGAGLALTAVGVAVSSQLRSDIPVWMLLLPVVAGLGLAWQQAANGQVRIIAGSAVTATLGNFLAGTAVLVVAVLVHGLVAGWPSAFPTEPWLYLGGVVGATFIGLASVVVRRTGVFLLGLGAIAGQLISSLAFDILFPIRDDGIAPATVVGAAITLGAVALAAIPSRSIRSR